MPNELPPMTIQTDMPEDFTLLLFAVRVGSMEGVTLGNTPPFDALGKDERLAMLRSLIDRTEYMIEQIERPL